MSNATILLYGMKFEVSYTYRAEIPARTWGRPEDCDEGCDEELDIDVLKYNELNMTPLLECEELYQDIYDAVLEHVRDEYDYFDEPERDYDA